MAMAALNMMEKIAFNALRPEGFTFRNFVTDGPKTGMDAKTYIQRDLSNLPEDDYIHSDENRLVRRDSLFREKSWRSGATFLSPGMKMTASIVRERIPPGVFRADTPGREGSTPFKAP